MNVQAQAKGEIILLIVDARDVTPANFPKYANMLRTTILNNFTPNATIVALKFTGPDWVKAASVCIANTIMPTVGLVEGENVIIVATTTPEYAPGMVIPLPK